MDLVNYSTYDVNRMMRDFERIAQIQRDRREAMEFLLYLARRDHRHLVIDKNPEGGDAWVSIPAPPDEGIQLITIDTSILTIPTNPEHLTWNSTSFTGS